MSASNEKKTRKDAISETPKTAMEIEKQKAEKRSNFLYGPALSTAPPPP